VCVFHDTRVQLDNECWDPFFFNEKKVTLLENPRNFFQKNKSLKDISCFQ
jgi:hypothetical protein